MLLAANLSLLYAHLPVDGRFAAAAGDGFRHVEILAPYDQTPQWYAHQLRENGLSLVLVNTPRPSPDQPVGRAAQPGQQAGFRADMQRAAEVCQACGCPAVHVMAGRRDPRHGAQEQLDVLVDNLQWAAAQFPQLRLQLEALNRQDQPGYFYHVQDEVAQVLARAGVATAVMQFDFYHVVREAQNVAEELSRHFARVGHVQVAGAPARDEPDLSRDGLLAGFERLHALGYAGHIGLEYRPRAGVAVGLAWLQPLLDRALVSF